MGWLNTEISTCCSGKLPRYVIMALVLTGLSMSAVLRAQDPYVEFYGRSLVINNIGMAALGTWALANISIGAYGWNKQSGERAYFHQMNLFWNTVNLSIAGVALYSNMSSDYELLSGQELLDKHFKTQRLYLINGALDVGYIATGFLLKYLAPKYPKNELRLAGYGNSVILQGSFLLLFDLVMCGVLRSHRMDFLHQLAFSPMQDALGLVISYNF